MLWHNNIMAKLYESSYLYIHTYVHNSWGICHANRLTVVFSYVCVCVFTYKYATLIDLELRWKVHSLKCRCFSLLLLAFFFWVIITKYHRCCLNCMYVCMYVFVVYYHVHFTFLIYVCKYVCLQVLVLVLMSK